MIKIISEPRGSIYTALIKYAGKKCTSFSLIWPVDMKIDDSAYQIHQELIEFIESEGELGSHLD